MLPGDGRFDSIRAGATCFGIFIVVNRLGIKFGSRFPKQCVGVIEKSRYGIMQLNSGGSMGRVPFGYFSSLRFTGIPFSLHGDSRAAFL